MIANVVVSAVAMAFGGFAAASPHRAAEIWGWQRLQNLAPERRAAFISWYRVFGILLFLAGLLFEVDCIVAALTYPNTIGTDAVYQNMGNSNYNSLQTSLKRTAGHFTFLASYIALSVASCSGASHEPLHLRTSASDYRSLGITPGKVQRWEDGRRTAPDEKSFEWWYFDALMEDGTAVVVVFSDNFAQDHKRGVSLELTSPDGKHRTLNTKFDEPGVFAKDHTFVQIGENKFEGDLDTYSIKVSADNPQHLGVDLVLKRRYPSFRAATGQLSSGPAYFAWLNAVPSGTVTGTITIGGKAMAASGEGYHDHNWGNVPPSDLLDKWWWGRASVGQHRIVTYEIHGKKSVGGTNIGLYYVGTEDGIEVNAVGDQVAVLDGPLVKHPDPKHERPIPASISYAANGTTSNFSISGPMLLSVDLLAEQPWSAKLVASVFGMKPRYTRFQSPVSLSVAGRPIERGTGILEYYELQ